jgi:hypothetical protein
MTLYQVKFLCVQPNQKHTSFGIEHKISNKQQAEEKPNFYLANCEGNHESLLKSKFENWMLFISGFFHSRILLKKNID